MDAGGTQRNNMHIIFNAIAMLAELAAIAGVAWFGFSYPLLFAGVTALTALTLGIALEIARLKNEFPFYFDRQPGLSAYFIVAVGDRKSVV